MKTIERLAPKYRAAILEISDERKSGDGIWIYFKGDIFNPHIECGFIHEYTIAECIRQLKYCVNNPITREEYANRFN